VFLTGESCPESYIVHIMCQGTVPHMLPPAVQDGLIIISVIPWLKSAGSMYRVVRPAKACPPTRLMSRSMHGGGMLEEPQYIYLAESH
jgi:hypothetical protein